MGKIIAIAISKGGVGKTTTAVNLSLALSKKNKKVLLIDVDPSGQCLSSFALDSNLEKGDVFDVFTSTKKIDQVIYETEYENLWCIPMKPSSYEAEIRLANLSQHFSSLKYSLTTIALQYDFIFIDCPPILSGTTSHILNIANSVLIPITASKYSFDELERILNHVKTIKEKTNNELKIEGILLTLDEPRTKLSHNVKKKLILKYPNFILKTTIPKTVKIREATFKNKPVLFYDPDSIGAKAFKNLADEILLRNELSDFFFRG